MSEAFKPIAIQPPSDNRLLFGFRCLLDLQLLTTFNFLRREMRGLRGKVLDVGAGESPWRELLQGASYTGLDVESAEQFGMQRKADIVYYDGCHMPFADESFDHIVCSEVLEHVPDAAHFMSELARVLRRGGSLVLTVPWSARLHHLPHDYFRYTRQGLEAILDRAGFGARRIEERGNDVAVIANKVLVLNIRLLKPRLSLQAVWTWPLAVLLAPVTLAFLAAAHVALRLRLGAWEDPLGYGLVATKPPAPPVGA